jgi:hypothetical protein
MLKLSRPRGAPRAEGTAGKSAGTIHRVRSWPVTGRVLAAAAAALTVTASLAAVAGPAAAGTGQPTATATAPARQSPAHSPTPARHAVSVPGDIAPGAATLGKIDYKRVCSVAPPGHAACMALIRTDLRSRRQPAAAPNTPPTGYGYGPADLQNAYKLPSTFTGSGQTVAVVDAYDDPNAAADLATYRAAWGLPPCGSGCFTKVNQTGQASPLPAPAGTTGWDQEESLDLDMVSAICPLCHIILVEANSNANSDLYTAEDTAVALGAKYVSNSWAECEYPGETADDTHFNHPGVAITAASGDWRYNDQGLGCNVPSYPATSKYVTAVGGTSLTHASNARGWTETVWDNPAAGKGTGSGCSAYEPKPSWQTDTGCAHRTDNDVAAVANPNTGVAIYDTYSLGGWAEFGGTSAATPIIASVFALAGTPDPGSYPSSYIYQQHPRGLYDVTSGSNGTCSPAYLCTAGPGYDGPTGWGTPHGRAAFTLHDIITVANPGPQHTRVEFSASLQIKASATSGSTLSYSATGLPPGLAINQAKGLISGTPTQIGSYTVTVTAVDRIGTQGSATFTWGVSVFGSAHRTAAANHPAGKPTPSR